MTRVELVLGDITRQRVDAIVNAANEGLWGGGGVDGAIHLAGGLSILRECDRIRETRGGCPTGTAVVTGAGDLPARAVIHTVGPRWKGGGRGEDGLLASAWRSSLELAASLGHRTVAFPSISTGVYGFPIERAATIALGVVRDFVAERPEVFDEIRIVLWSPADLVVYREARERLGEGSCTTGKRPDRNSKP